MSTFPNSTPATTVRQPIAQYSIRQVMRALPPTSQTTATRLRDWASAPDGTADARHFTARSVLQVLCRCQSFDAFCGGDRRPAAAFTERNLGLCSLMARH